MKKTGLLLLLMVTATFAVAQQSTTAVTPDASGIVNTSVNVPFVRFQTPTAADIYCAGFLTKERVPDANYVNGGLQTPDLNQVRDWRTGLPGRHRLPGGTTVFDHPRNAGRQRVRNLSRSREK